MREVTERGTPPSEEDMDLFVVRTRLYQVEGDPAAVDEAARLPGLRRASSLTLRLSHSDRHGDRARRGWCPLMQPEMVTSPAAGDVLMVEATAGAPASRHGQRAHPGGRGPGRNSRLTCKPVLA